MTDFPYQLSTSQKIPLPFSQPNIVIMTLTPPPTAQFTSEILKTIGKTTLVVWIRQPLKHCLLEESMPGTTLIKVHVGWHPVYLLDLQSDAEVVTTSVKVTSYRITS